MKKSYCLDDFSGLPSRLCVPLPSFGPSAKFYSTRYLIQSEAEFSKISFL